jgi:hypothetical protein
LGELAQPYHRTSPNLGKTSQHHRHGNEIRERIKRYRGADLFLTDEINRVELCWNKAESHLAGLRGLAPHLRQDDLPTILSALQTFYRKLEGVNDEIEALRRPSGAKRLKYAIGFRKLGGLVTELEQWCDRLDHDHLRRNISFEEEARVRQVAGQTLGWARSALAIPWRSVDSAPEPQLLTAPGSEHTLSSVVLSSNYSRNLTKGWKGGKRIPGMEGKVRSWSPLGMLAGLFRVFRRRRAD